MNETSPALSGGTITVKINTDIVNRVPESSAMRRSIRLVDFRMGYRPASLFVGGRSLFSRGIP